MTAPEQQDPVEELRQRISTALAAYETAKAEACEVTTWLQLMVDQIERAQDQDGDARAAIRTEWFTARDGEDVSGADPLLQCEDAERAFAAPDSQGGEPDA